MPLWGDILVGVVILIGLLGTIVQVLPGATIVGIAVAIWGGVQGGAVGWTVCGVAIALTLVGYVAQYLVPGKFMKARGVPNSALLAGAVAAVVGFFVIPVVGLFVGFIGGVFLAEYVRVREVGVAWPATVNALKAAGLAILTELTVAMLVTGTWIVGLILR